ncbi:hypothetical protein [Bacteroides reticulotermitis]|uniref:hypothetical protein n=1 Tax=Bacteroides reticulotermitis TaxID=1133319 RepID=UPI003A883466
MIDIKNKLGATIFSTPVNDGCIRRFTLMKEDYVSIRFNAKTPIVFSLGDGIDDEYGMFELVDLYKPTYNDGSYSYELRLDAYYWKWKNKIFKFTPEVGGQEAAWNLTDTLDVHLSILIRNLNALGYKYRGSTFQFSIDSTVQNSSKVLSYSNTNLIDALTMMAEAWECEWWITDNIIHFGRCEYGTPISFKIGDNVASMSRSDSNTDYATRLYVFGSTRNIPTDYRPVDESIVVNGVVQKRLMLPAGTPYIDSKPGMYQEEAVEKVVIFDEIYPRRVGTMSEVAAHPVPVKDENGNDTGQTVNIYQFKDLGILFSSKYILEGEDLKIVFQSGSLNGMEFGVAFNPNGEPDPLPNGSGNPDAQLWEITRNEDYGRFLPDDILKPENGDTYVLSGFNISLVSDQYVPAAEQELKAKGEEHIQKLKIDPSTYDCTMNCDYMYGINPVTGKQDDTYKKTFEIGDKVNLINDAFFETGNRQSRIIGYEYKLDKKYDSPVYTIGETPSYSRIGDIESKVDSLIYKGETYSGSGGAYIIGTNDSTLPTNRNVFSALRSLLTFIRRDIAETFSYITTFLAGIRIGNFISGMIGGRGARITPDGDIEARSLTLRDSLIVPKITFNCIDVISGDKANTFAFGSIKSVDTATRIAELDLLDGELGTLKSADICRGIFHNLEGGNKTDNSYDANGYLNYSGFSTSYFTPVEILVNEPGRMVFRYVLQSGTSIHPIKGMNFFAYGNFNDKSRQAITYENRYYTRRLKNVSTWVINPDKNIAMQDGLLEGLTINGVEMHGYGTYEENAYLIGPIIQFTPSQKEELKGQDAYSVILSTYEQAIVVDDDNNIIGGTVEELTVISGDNTVVTGEATVVTSINKLTSRIQAFKGKTELFYSPTYEEGAYMVTLNPIGCVAVIENGIVKITEIIDVDNISVGITVNCEGNAIFEKVFKITAVRNGQSPIVVDFTNGMINLACDASGNVVHGLPATTNLMMFYGTEQLALSELTLSPVTGITMSADKATGVITISSVASSVPDTTEINVTATAIRKGITHTRTIVLSLNKIKPGANGENAVIYDLNPSSATIKILADGSLVNSNISCGLSMYNGTEFANITSIPSGYSMKYSKDGGAYADFTPNQIIDATDIASRIIFRLLQDSTIVDEETVYVVKDGDIGQDGKDANILVPSVSQIGKKLNGVYEPEIFTVYHKSANGTAVNANIVCWGSDDGINYSVIDNAVDASSISIDVASEMAKYYVIRTYTKRADQVSDFSEPFILSTSVNVVSDGEAGVAGSAYRKWDGFEIGKTYRNDDGVVDLSKLEPEKVRYIDVILIKNSALQAGADVYIAKKFGGNNYWVGTNENDPRNEVFVGNESPHWIRANSMAPVFTNLIIANAALIDFGTIGAFIYQGDYMFSQHGVDGDGNDSTDYQYFNNETYPFKFNNTSVWSTTPPTSTVINVMPMDYKLYITDLYSIDEAYIASPVISYVPSFRVKILNTNTNWTIENDYALRYIYYKEGDSSPSSINFTNTDSTITLPANYANGRPSGFFIESYAVGSFDNILTIELVPNTFTPNFYINGKTGDVYGTRGVWTMRTPDVFKTVDMTSTTARIDLDVDIKKNINYNILIRSSTTDRSCRLPKATKDLVGMKLIIKLSTPDGTGAQTLAIYCNAPQYIHWRNRKNVLYARLTPDAFIELECLPILRDTYAWYIRNAGEFKTDSPTNQEAILYPVWI